MGKIVMGFRGMGFVVHVRCFGEMKVKYNSILKFRRQFVVVD
jgi:hypothetical protein